MIGDGELTITDLLDNLNQLDKVAGIAYKNGDGDVVLNPPRKLPRNLDFLPYPAYELFDMDQYTDHALFGYDYVGAKYRNRKVASMITSQGCPYTCRFCSDATRPLEWKYRMRSIDNLIGEMEFLIDKYGVGGIDFADDLLVVSKKRMYELSEKIKPLGLKWCGQARVEQVDDDLLKTMADAGCASLGFGAETGSPMLLKAMDKRSTVEDIKRAINGSRKAGLGIKLQLIYGYPGESHQTIRETIQLLKDLHHPGRSFNVMTPIPGSPVYEELMAEERLGTEEEILEIISSLEFGFRNDRFVINLSEFDDEEFMSVKEWAEVEMRRNYSRYLMTHPLALLKTAYLHMHYDDRYNRFLKPWTLIPRAYKKFQRRLNPGLPEKRSAVFELYKEHYEF